MGQHKVVECLDLQCIQIVQQRVLGFGRAGVNQAPAAILAEQHGVALPHVQHIDNSAAVGDLRGAFLGLQRRTEESAQLLPGGNRAFAARKLDDERGAEQHKQ